MDSSEKAERKEAAEEMVMRETSSRWNEKDVTSVVCFSSVELLHDGFEDFRDWKGQKEISEIFLDRRFKPGAGVDGVSRTNIHIIEKEETVEQGGVVETDGSCSRFGKSTMISERRMLHRQRENEKHNWNEIRKDINCPFIGGVGAGGGVRFIAIKEIGRRVGDLYFFDFEVGSLCLKGRDAGREGRGGRHGGYEVR